MDQGLNLARETTVPVWNGMAAHLKRISEIRPGLRVHADDTVDSVDATVQGVCVPGLHLVLLLEGRLDVSYGARRASLSTRRTAGAGRPRNEAQAILISAEEAECFTRRIQRGRYARRVSLSMSPEWIEQLMGASQGPVPGRLEALFRGHLAMEDWTPSPRAVALAEQIVRPPSSAPILRTLYLESRLLELIAEAMAAFADPASAHAATAVPASLNPGVVKRMRELRDYLTEHHDDDLSLQDIARHAGSNPNTLQLQFRQAFGSTIFEFLRDTRMTRARQALERDAVSVKQAAVMAGYTSAANFSTAYKRHFGLSPKQSRPPHGG